MTFLVGYQKGAMNISQNVLASVSLFNKIEDLKLVTLLKKELRQKCLLVSFAKYYSTFPNNTFARLLLNKEVLFNQWKLSACELIAKMKIS